MAAQGEILLELHFHAFDWKAVSFSSKSICEVVCHDSIQFKSGLEEIIGWIHPELFRDPHDDQLNIK